MHIGICKLSLRIPASQSLKAKRRVVKSLSERLRSRFNIAISEVDNRDTWQLATLGYVCVNTDIRHLQTTMDKISSFVAQQQGDYEILDEKREVMSGL